MMKQNVEEYQAYKRGEKRLPEHLAPRKGLQGRLFKSPLLESLSRTTIAPPLVMHIAISSFVFWYGLSSIGLSIYLSIILFISGAFFWTFAEYLVHRFLYHTESNSTFLFTIQHNGHGIHHQYPKDPTRFAMPPLPGLILAGMFFGLFYITMGKFTFAFFPGFMIGYLIYITIHVLQHKYIIPKLPFLKKLWKHHILHHFKDPYSAYGVSTRFWDMVFGTMPKE